MKLKVAICDDENIICEEIKRTLSEAKPDYYINIYNTGKALIDSNKVYDLIFLDIQMRDLNGMETAKLLRKNKHNEYIIFLTSHVEFMPDAFKVKAFRFLNKPLKMDKFFEAVNEAEKEILNEKKIVIDLKGKSELINLQDIIYFEAYGDGTYIYTKTNIFESNKQLKYWIEEVGIEHFYKIHKSYFVALRHVKSINNNEIDMNYVSNQIPISRRRYVEFKKTLFSYTKKNAQFI